MKRVMLALALMGGFILTGVPVAHSTQDTDLHCPDGGVKVNVNDDNDAEDDDQDVVNALVLDEGTRVCVKAGPGNTDIVIADGEDTLQEILFDNGIKDGSGEQGRDVSYYVIYPPLLEAFVCFEGEIEVFTNVDQAALNLLVSAYLELHVGAVQVESADAECEVVVTTTTTAPPVTTTTAPPVVEETATQQTLRTAAPVAAAPAPTSAPAPVSQLPRTGSGTLLTLLGGGLTGSGLLIRRLFRK